jgi:hypothetical protein
VTTGSQGAAKPTNTPTSGQTPTGVSADMETEARENVTDSPAALFENNPQSTGASPAALWDQTVLPATVRAIETFTIPGLGSVQYWVANTKQQGICTGLRLPGGSWAGLQGNGQVGGAMPGCRPTREQLSGGSLLLDGFDYQESDVVAANGQVWAIQYGVVSRPGATRVRDTTSGTTVPVIDGKYFAIALPTAGSDWENTGYHLVALDASNQPVAQEGQAGS